MPAPAPPNGRSLSETSPGPVLHAAPAALPGETGSAIERLIDGTVMPASLPGLEVRLLPPAERSGDDTSTSVDSPDLPPVGEETQREAAVRAPFLDIDALADRIFLTLQRREQFERERRGLY